MRAAKILKYLAYVVVVLGILFAFNRSDQGILKFWITILISLVSWCFLRVAANVAQIIYDMKSELSRILGNLERSSYRINATLKETRDLIELNQVDSKQ